MLNQFYDQIVEQLKAGSYEILKPATKEKEPGQPLNVARAKVETLNFLVFRFSALHGIAVPNKSVFVPKSNQKELKEFLLTIRLQDFFDFIQHTKVEKKLHTLVGTEKRKAREKITAEIFTPNGLVNEMLDELPCELWYDSDKTFLDDSAGNGQFLIWVLLRKIQAGQDPIEALKRVYGVELMPDNVEECKQRILSIIKLWTPITKEHEKIVNKNIVCHDALTYDYEFK